MANPLDDIEPLAMPRNGTTALPPGRPRPPFWSDPEALAHLIPRPSQVILCYELAPTGRIHAGIVRTLLYADTLRNLLAQTGSSSRLIIRVNDRAGNKERPSSSTGAGASLAASMPAKGGIGTSALEQLLTELSTCAAHFGVQIDQVDLVSTVYANERFRGLARKLIGQAAAIRNALSRCQTTSVVLFRPLCAVCRCMYSAELPAASWDGHGTYNCLRCSHSGSFSAESSEGLFAFKLESALMWEYYRADVDLHGQDHVEAFQTSSAITTLMSWHVPLAGRVNLTFNTDGQKLSKSRDNFVPIVELDSTVRRTLKELIWKAPWRAPLHLPSIYSAKTATREH